MNSLFDERMADSQAIFSTMRELLRQLNRRLHMSKSKVLQDHEGNLYLVTECEPLSREKAQEMLSTLNSEKNSLEGFLRTASDNAVEPTPPAQGVEQPQAQPLVSPCPDESAGQTPMPQLQ